MFSLCNFQNLTKSYYNELIVLVQTVCSNLMRQLARILIEARKRLQKNEADMSDLLYPEFYPIIVESARAITGFDCETKPFKSPSLSTEVWRTLKKAVKTHRKNILVKNPFVPCENARYSTNSITTILRIGGRSPGK